MKVRLNMAKNKKLHIGTLDSIKGFKNISLDLKTYESIFELSQNNNMGVDLSVAKTIKFLFNFYSQHQQQEKTKILNESLQNVKISKAKKVIKL